MDSGAVRRIKPVLVIDCLLFDLHLNKFLGAIFKNFKDGCNVAL